MQSVWTAIAKAVDDSCKCYIGLNSIIDDIRPKTYMFDILDSRLHHNQKSKLKNWTKSNHFTKSKVAAGV